MSFYTLELLHKKMMHTAIQFLFKLEKLKMATIATYFDVTETIQCV